MFLFSRHSDQNRFFSAFIFVVLVKFICPELLYVLLIICPEHSVAFFVSPSCFFGEEVYFFFSFKCMFKAHRGILQS